MTTTLLHSARIFDGFSPDLGENRWVLIEDGLIREVGTGGDLPASDIRIDVAGKVLMPGLIDAHNHIWLADMVPTRLVRQRSEYIAAFATMALQKTLKRGFTTIRDAGGTDIGYARAVEAGIVDGPRLYHAGRMMSQTGGHGDFRPPDEYDCGCSTATGGQERFVAIVDGVDAMRKAVREELRKGAHQIKIMGSGGVASPADPLDRIQFTDAEILAAVEEAQMHGVYVMAHCHPAQAIARCARLGVRSIEHGSLIDAEAARAVVEAGAYVVPTLVTLNALYEDSANLGMPQASVDKIKLVYEGNLLRGLEIMQEAGVRMGFGTDLIAHHQDMQCREFTLRREVLPALDILRSATRVNAEIMGLTGKLGCIGAGAFADLIVVDGNPLDDISLLTRPEIALALIMRGGRLFRNDLVTSSRT